jgi:hypothetical protein
MAIDWRTTSRGAVAGVAAAGVWAAQQPLDKHLLASDYDDVELLGKSVVGGPGWYPAGLAMHLANGAIFGAAYANVAHRVPIPAWLRGPVAAIAQNFAMWPLGRISDRLHPRADQLPELAGNRRALAQTTWRHLVFGVVLGELERRLNPPEEPLPETYEAYVSSNGHGSIEHAAASQSAS